MTDNTKPDIAVQHVEQQLQEQGAFSPLAWLLDQGWLSYPDYEAWRQGEYATLTERLPFPVSELEPVLAQVEQLALRLKLTAEQQRFFSWRSGQGERALCLAPDTGIADQLALRWTRASEDLQLDLFMDNGTALAEQAVVDALAGRDLARAEDAYQRMLALSPGHEGLADLEALLAYAGYLEEQPEIDDDALQDEFIALTQDIAPLAQRALRGQARDFLAPGWRRLAAALSGVPYDPVAPDFHASYAWSQVADWPQVINSVSGHHDDQVPARLLARWAWALQQMRLPERALWVWARLFEDAPEHADELLAWYPFPRLRQLRQRYDDLDQDWPDAWFSPWLLLAEPGLTHSEPETEGLPTPRSALWHATAAVATARQQGHDELPARKQLQVLAPALLQWYLQASTSK